MSSSRFNSISISVTNEDNGDLEEKARVRARIKRKKLGFRGKTDVLLRIITMIVKWWMILIFLLAILLLLIEASRIAGKAKEEVKSDFSLPSRNLNHLNPMTGNVNASNNVNETAVVHCGFYSDNGGFRISDGDRSYMQTCEAVVSTCAFGGGDDLYQPIGMTEASLRKVCFVAFWDEITHSTQEAEGKRIGEGHLIGRWHIVVVMDLPFTDQRLNGKIPKTLSHRLFPRAWFSIWVDSKSQFRRDPLGVLEALLWHTNSVLAISEHGARSDIYDEGKAIVNKHKVTPEEVEVQLSQYCRDGHPEDKRFNGKRALVEASVIVREHTPLTNLFMCLWFNEVVRFTSRDQLSIPFFSQATKSIEYKYVSCMHSQGSCKQYGSQAKRETSDKFKLASSMIRVEPDVNSDRGYVTSAVVCFHWYDGGGLRLISPSDYLLYD